MDFLRDQHLRPDRCAPDDYSWLNPMTYQLLDRYHVLNRVDLPFDLQRVITGLIAAYDDTLGKLEHNSISNRTRDRELERVRDEQKERDTYHYNLSQVVMGIRDRVTKLDSRPNPTDLEHGLHQAQHQITTLQHSNAALQHSNAALAAQVAALQAQMAALQVQGAPVQEEEEEPFEEEPFEKEPQEDMEEEPDVIKP